MRFPSWTANRTSGRPFDNVVLIRNPKGLQRDDLHLGRGRHPGARWSCRPRPAADPIRHSLFEERRAAFLDDPLVRQHVAEAADRWAAMLALNDGGISHLADRLELVCRSGTQARPDRLARRDTGRGAVERAQGLRRIGRSPGARLAERLGAINEVIEDFLRRPTLLGLFLATLHADPARLGRRFLEIAPAECETDGGLASDDERDHASIRIDLDGHEPVPARTMPMRFGDGAGRHRLEEIERRAGDEELARAVGLSCEQFRTVAAELAVAARRFETAGQVETCVRETVALPRPRATWSIGSRWAVP